MAEKLVREETPIEFFREQLERAMEHQKVSTSAFTEFYLAQNDKIVNAAKFVPMTPEQKQKATDALAALWARDFR